MWEASDRICGKRLKALLPTLVAGNRSVKRGSAFIVPCFSVIELAGGFEYFVAGAGEKTAVGGW